MGAVHRAEGDPRSSNRLDVVHINEVKGGAATTAQCSRIPGEGTLTMFSLNMGFLFGGEATRPR